MASYLTHIALIAIALVFTTIAADDSSCAVTFSQYPEVNLTTCTTLPVNGAKLAWSWDNVTRIMSAVFTHQPEGPSGWIAWGINHNDTISMTYSSVLACYPDQTGVPAVTRFFLVDKEEDEVIARQGLLRVVTSACVFDSSTNPPTYHMKFELNLGTKPKIYQVYGGGPSVRFENGTPYLKDHSPGSNVGVFIDIRNTTFVAGKTSEFYTSEKNIHGVLNAVGWGILMPLGAMIARYMRFADPLWFFLHGTVQSTGYIVGTVGFGYGVWLWEKTEGAKEYTHYNLGIIIFVLATLQIMSVLIKPKKDSSNRIYWNLYHWTGGLTVIILATVNNFIGFHILKDYGDWRTAYIAVIAILAGLAAVLELIMWSVYLSRDSSAEVEEKDDSEEVKEKGPSAEADKEPVITEGVELTFSDGIK